MGDTLRIYDELFELRASLRRRDTVGRKEPKICPDEALMDMAERLPTRNEDLLMIKGLGEAFVDHYGNDFLSVTRRHVMDSAEGIPLMESDREALKDMERKLINVNKGNPLLYSPRTVRSRTIDITAVGDPLRLLFHERDGSIECSSDDRTSFDRLNMIAREVLRERREKGTDDLYIAYPFAVGKLSDDFPIRAPLVLYPVRMERAKGRITITNDSTRDALYNNALILASMRNGTKGHLPDPVMDAVSEDISTMLGFYRDNGVVIEDDRSPLRPFREYRGDEAPEPGDVLRVERSALLGKFPMYSSSVQRDLEALVSKGSINGMLHRLITEGEGKDITDDPMPVLERDMVYINPINSSQEKVIEAMRHRDGLVVQGPPGTGKSQVITGIITTAVDNGMNVLMVSEKKTALDVVYSRLGELSRYAMLIDDVNNKDLFYDQLKVMLSSDTLKDSVPEDISGLSDGIEERISQLTSIADGMYRPDAFGVEPYLMYSLVKKVDLNDPKEHERYMLLKDNISSSLMDVSYRDLSEAYERFKDKRMISDLRTYYQCLESMPWMAHLRRDLSPAEVRALREELKELSREYRESNTGELLDRLYGKGKITRMATAISVMERP